MKRMDIKFYNKNMGTLIDIQNEVDYQKKHHKDSINIPYEKLMLNYKTILKKGHPYFIVCEAGSKSRKAVSILEFFGYDVTQMSYKASTS